MSKDLVVLLFLVLAMPSLLIAQMHSGGGMHGNTPPAPPTNPPTRVGSMMAGTGGSMMADMEASMMGARHLEVGTDGTAYLVDPQPAVTESGTVTSDLLAIPTQTTPQVAWSTSLEGLVHRLMLGQNTLYAVVLPASLLERMSSGGQMGENDRNGHMGSGSAPDAADARSRIVYLSAADGSQLRTIEVGGLVQAIEVRTVAGAEQLYVAWREIGTGAEDPMHFGSGPLRLTIFGANGEQIKSVNLP